MGLAALTFLPFYGTGSVNICYHFTAPPQMPGLSFYRFYHLNPYAVYRLPLAVLALL